MHILRSSKDNTFPQWASNTPVKDSDESIKMRIVGKMVCWRKLGKLIGGSSFGLK